MKYTEIFRLKTMLEDAGIPYEYEKNHNDYFINHRIKYPDRKNIKCSVIEGDFSYGGDDDLLEIMGLLTDEEWLNDEVVVVGCLTAEDVFKRIKKDWEEKN